MPIPTRGRHHTPSLLFATIINVDPPRVLLTDEDEPIPLEWVDDTVTLVQDARCVVVEVAPKQWAIVSILDHVDEL